MYKLAKIAVLVIGVISCVLWVLIARSDNPDNSSTNIMLHVGKGLTYFAAALTIIYSIINLASDGTKLKKALLGVGLFVLIFAVSYFVLANSDAVGTASAGASRLVDAGLWMFYILTLVAVGSMGYFGLKKSLSK